MEQLKKVTISDAVVQVHWAVHELFPEIWAKLWKMPHLAVWNESNKIFLDSDRH